MKMMKIGVGSLLLALSLLFSPAQAGEHSLTWTIASWHHDRRHDYNENNRGLLYSYQTEDTTFVAGRYLNSFDRKSWVVAAGPRWDNWSVVFGAVTNYEDGETTPIALPIYRYGIADFVVVPGVVYGVGLKLVEW